MRRRQPVTVDGHSHGDHGARFDVAQLRARPPVDHAGRQVQEQVEDARNVVAAQQAAIELLHLGPDAGYGGEGAEERIEHARPHGLFLSVSL